MDKDATEDETGTSGTVIGLVMSGKAMGTRSGLDQ